MTRAGGGCRVFGMIETKPQRPFFSWENYRLLFTVVFWLLVTITYWGYFIVLVGEDGPAAGLLGVTLSFAALVATWHLLPWTRDAGLRLLAVPLFLASVFWVNHAMVALDQPLFWPLFLLVFAQAVFAFGPRWSVAYGAVVLGLIFAYLQITRDASVLEDALFIVMLLPYILLVAAASAAIFEVARRRGESEALLSELEEAHHELREYARRVRELSISGERTRMAREIHDSVGHYLAVVNVQLEAAGKLLDRDPGAAREQIERAKTSASGALSEVRRSVRALRPLDVTERSGSGALAALAGGFEGAGPSVSFAVRGEERELSPEAELVLYRALQEGLTNALKHGHANRVTSTLTFAPDGTANLVVADDGDGAPEEFMEGGFGLQALSDRAAKLGGTVEAGNAEDGGFTLKVELPA